MSTTYGSAKVGFLGFRPLTFSTIDGVVDWRGPSWTGRYFPSRAWIRERSRLSKKERSRLFTFAKKWAKNRGVYVSDCDRMRLFRTLERRSYN